jgi:hypothetical protein
MVVSGLLPLLTLGALVPGCGRGFARVDGQVTIEGKPISGGSQVRGTVFFHPESGATAPSVGIVDASGRYEMTTGSTQGVMPGAYLVTISAAEIIPAASAGEAPSGRRLSALKYSDPKQSGLRVEVKSGRNSFDFALESSPRS